MKLSIALRSALQLKNKFVLITGGANGIGLATAKEFLKHDVKGISILDVCENSGKQSLNELQNKFKTQNIIFVKTDISDENSFENGFQKTIDAFGKLDIVVNNAGVIKEGDWRSSIDINLKGVIQGTKLATETYLPKYKDKDEPVVVNVASIAALDEHNGLFPVYTSTKHGILGFSKCLGFIGNYQKNKIRILTVCPGFTDTKIIQDAINQMTDEQKKAMESYPSENQKPEIIAQGIIKMIEKAEHGKVWLLDDHKTYDIKFPTLNEMKKRIDV